MKNFTRTFVLSFLMLTLGMVFGMQVAEAQDSGLAGKVDSSKIVYKYPIQSPALQGGIARPFPLPDAVCGNGIKDLGEDCEPDTLSETTRQYCNQDCQWEFPDGMEECLDQKKGECKEEVEIFIEKGKEDIATHEEFMDLRIEGRERYQQCVEESFIECAPEEKPEEPVVEKTPEVENKIQQEPEALGGLSGSGCSLSMAGTAGNMPAWILGLVVALGPIWKRRKS